MPDDTLIQQARDLFAVTLSEAQAAQFDVLARELIDWNTRVNLTAITDAEGVRVRHFLDSLSLLRAVTVRDGMQVIDVGTGAGFPGLPLAMLYPGATFTLLEATGKKVAFIDHIVARLGLKNVRTVHARAEEAGRGDDHRAAYDLVLARAVARMPALAEYLLPLAKIGGRCVAMKGAGAPEETDSAARALRVLGGRLERIVPVTLPGISDAHNLVVIEKVARTPPEYPRNPGTPTRKPITG